MDHDRPPQPPIPEARTVLLPEFFLWSTIFLPNEVSICGKS